jgi:hypothetical protein
MLSVYFGMLLALALYNLLLWVSLRDRELPDLRNVCRSMAVGQLSFNGLGNQFLWPGWPAMGQPRVFRRLCRDRAVRRAVHARFPGNPAQPATT